MRALCGLRNTLGTRIVAVGGPGAWAQPKGVVPALICESLGMPLVTNARAVELLDGNVFRVTRVTSDGDEVVEVAAPAVVTVSNELGEPRYPTAKSKIAARRMKPEEAAPDSLGLPAEALQPRVQALHQFVPEVQGNCEFLSGETPAELADALVARLRQDSLIP